MCLVDILPPGMTNNSDEMLLHKSVVILVQSKNFSWMRESTASARLEVKKYIICMIIRERSCLVVGSLPHSVSSSGVIKNVRVHLKKVILTSKQIKLDD